MWSNWAENAKSSMTQALEKTGDALSKAATNAGKSARKDDRSPSAAATVATDGDNQAVEPEPKEEEEPPAGGSSSASAYDQPTIAAIPDKRQEIFQNFSQGWSSMVETTKASVRQAEQKVEASLKQAEEKVKTRLSKARATYYKRDPSLPLDVEALKDAEVVYITDRIITMGHPAMASQVNGDISGERKLAAVGHLLDRRHDGRYMVWNLSEVDYDGENILNNQVLTFSFPGSPSPPLGLLLKLLVSMESWLKADDRNVAVVHCLTGKGRTSTVLAAFLCWMGQAGFSDIYQALEYIAACKQMSADELTIPSQRRYASYFKNMLDGVRPSQPPLMLRRIIMSEAPRYAKGPPRTDSAEGGGDSKKSSSKQEDSETQLLGCVPYLQIFKAGKLLQTTPASLHFQQAENELPFCQVADGNISFHVNLVVQGDILVRARHLTANKKRVSMFRAAFHTGYAPPNVMRLTKSQLDGACTDDRFVEDFFLDFILEPVDAEEASRLLKEEEEEKLGVASDDAASGEKPAAAAPGSGNKAMAVQASADDFMLHRDSRFWEVIATRMKEHAADNSEREEDNMWGPTVGRRRDFSSVEEGGEDAAEGGQVVSEQERNALETFSIGGEFDFLPETVEPEPAHPVVSPAHSKKAAPKKDSLMEALMGALDDDDVHDDDDDEGHEVVVFESDAPTPQEQQSAAAFAAESASAPASTKEGETAEVAAGSEKKEAAGDAGAATAEPPTTTADDTASKQQSSAVDDDMEKLMAEANLDLEDDMDALLEGAGGLTDDDMLNLDVDDAELDDLESFLSPTNK